MKKARVGLAAVGLLALAAPLVSAGETPTDHPGSDRRLWNPAVYAQKYVEPGPRVRQAPTKPEISPSHSVPGGVGDAGGVAVGFSGGRANTRTAREVERDSIRQTIRRLG